MTNIREAIQKAPFCLAPVDVDWVYATYAGLSERRRLAQLFNVMLKPSSDSDLLRLAEIQPGAITQFLLGGADLALQTAKSLAEQVDVPLLVSADVEGGAISMECFTPMSNQLGMAAMSSEKLYEQAVEVMATEAAAIGVNWSFTPVIDINAAFRSAIVATRSFGSNLEDIDTLARAHVSVMQRKGLAATAKHWPGEGYDARDQHLVTTINPLAMDQWRERFGRLYKNLIDDGVLTIMSAHIALPAYAREQGLDGLETCRPACISSLLNIDLLRGELGFNGLITSDATPMGGLSSWGPRREVLPEVLENGCDMVLFSSDLDGDLDILELALEDGRLSAERVKDAVIRVLALKASLGLHTRTTKHSPTYTEVQPLLTTKEHLVISEAAAAASPTLVKDTQKLLPISLSRHRRVVLITDTRKIADDAFFKPPPLHLAKLLSERGFEVRVYDREEELSADNTDLVIYALAEESLLTKSNIYLDWATLLGPMEQAMTRTWHEIPSVLISFGHPYYLYDAPRMPCVINAYSAIEPVQHSVIRKLLGDEPFIGKSPVDAFCGLPDACY